MKLDDSSRGTSPRHFEEENPDVRKRGKKIYTAHKHVKHQTNLNNNTVIKPDKSSEHKRTEYSLGFQLGL